MSNAVKDVVIIGAGIIGSMSSYLLSKRAFILLAVAALLLVVAACSGGELATETQPNQTEQALAEKTERLEGEVASLRQELEEIQVTLEQQPKQLTPTPIKTASAPEPTSMPMSAPKPTATTIPIPTLSASGICGRSPEIQKAILSELEVSYCQPVNEAEMFRINGDWEVRLDEIRYGDFQGLVNVTSISVNATDIQAGAFAGLENLKTMRLVVHNYGSIAPGAWQGLDKLEDLSIIISYPYPDRGELLLTFPDFQHLPGLKNLRIGRVDHHSPRSPQLPVDKLSETLFSNLSNLEVLSLGLDSVEGEDIYLSNRLFLNNTELREVIIIIDDYGSDTKVYLPEGIFANNQELEAITLHYADFRMPRAAFKHLEKLEQISISAGDDYFGYDISELEFSEESPITSGYGRTEFRP